MLAWNLCSAFFNKTKHNKVTDEQHLTHCKPDTTNEGLTCWCPCTFTIATFVWIDQIEFERFLKHTYEAHTWLCVRRIKSLRLTTTNTIHKWFYELFACVRRVPYLTSDMLYLSHVFLGYIRWLDFILVIRVWQMRNRASFLFVSSSLLLK